MTTIDEPRLQSDLDYRFQYLAEFMHFIPEDIRTIHHAATLLAPKVPALVNAVYEQLHEYDATWRHFLPTQPADKESLQRALENLDENHDVIKNRKEHLSRYLVTLVTKPYDGNMLKYLDMVGKIHTSKAGNPKTIIPLVQMNALLGFVSDVILRTIISLNLDRNEEIQTLRAFNKLLWIQNDLINRHYSN
ncbi:MAG: hypothetical protein EBT92_10290 [Planctomycetes bacterium]|nr:hypothetical protein [Planctomycetota bacterium]NBY02816.1 hypothetical protein [Planctomycetota bacterium]